MNLQLGLMFARSLGAEAVARVAKIASVVIDAQAWYVFDLPLKYQWLKWDTPSFLRTNEEDWNEFLLQRQRERHPDIDSELPNVVRELDRVWIVQLNSGYEYSLEYEYRLSNRKDR